MKKICLNCIAIVSCILAFSACSVKEETTVVDVETATLVESETETTTEIEETTKSLYIDLNDTELISKVQEVANKLEFDSYPRYPSKETFPEQYNMVQELGKEAIPYLLLYVQESEHDDGWLERFFVHCANEMLNLNIMIGNWESDFRVECEHELYSTKWYAYQLMAYYKEGRHETQSKDVSELDIFKNYTDAEMMNIITEITDNNTVNPYWGGYPTIEENLELYKKFEKLGKEALPYILRWVVEFVWNEETLDEEILMQNFVDICALRLCENYYGDIPDDYEVDCRLGYPQHSSYELMSYLKDTGKCK